ncbi:MAG TPA: tetratricopeptide repeat protein [Thermoanaerobaculia bacterium]|nr:tetratricopeptide repeat protein [Thermoanaerobaculia bacterium]
MALSSGSRLGPYEILATLGAGGMGEVWRARDTRLGREVALKVLPEAFVDDRERISRFQREAQLLAAFNHPNIAAIYSFENVEGMQLLVMEMVPGETLKQLLAGGPLGVSRALAVARQVAEALDAAHGKGILHRDLKPANVKVTPEGKVKLLDFGLAKAFAPGPNASDISEFPTLDTGATRQGMVLGTAPYMSPEQARGRPLDWRTDVWAFGCLLYEMLAGKRAFTGESPSDILVAILDKAPDFAALPLDTPPQILDLIHECLAKNRDERTPDLAHARQAIDAVLEGRTTFVPSSGASMSARIRRRPGLYATTGALAAVAAAALLYLTFKGRDTTALPASKLLAILPATDLTGRQDGRQLCDGVSFSLGVKLQNVPGLAVMRPSGPAMLKETDPSKWARDTGANLLLQPAVRQMGDQRQLSFSVSLAGSPVQIAADEVTGPASDHFRLEEQLTRKLISALQVHLAGGVSAATPASPAVSPGPAQTDYVVALGYLERYDDRDSVDKAIDLLSKIPGGQNSALVQATLGRAYLASYDLSQDVSTAELAKKTAERAIALDPRLPEAQVTLGRILTATGEPEKAVDLVRKALEKRPDDAEGVRALAFALNKAGRLAEAESAFRRVVELKPRAWSAYSALGYFYFNAHQLQKAIDAYQRGIELNPDVARLYDNLGAAYMRSRRYGEAEKAFQRSNDIAPQPTGLCNLGTLYYIQGRYREAADAFSRAVRLNPLDYWNHKSLADALFRLPAESGRAKGEFEEAIRLARETLRVDPKSGEAYAAIGAALAKTKGPASGLDEIRRALSLEPDNPVVLQCAALVYASAGKADEALDAIDRALTDGLSIDEIETEPDFAPLHTDSRFRIILEKHRSRKETS